MKELPENAKLFFNERFKEVKFPEYWVFVGRLEGNLQLRNFVYPKLDSFLADWQNWERFLILVVDCAGLMQPEKTNEARELKKRAEKLKQDISICCENLASSIDELDELGEQGYIDTPYITDSIRLAIEAGQENYMFKWHIEEKLNKAMVGFDRKYFPSVQDLIRRVGAAYKEQQIDFSYNYMILNKRASPRDFCVKLKLSIDDFILSKALPNAFKLTQSEIADFCNALLLDESSITTENVKTYLHDFKKSQVE